jgi:hypothetical protein
MAHNIHSLGGYFHEYQKSVAAILNISLASGDKENLKLIFLISLDTVWV